jgi:hypothetical protein
VMSIAIEVSVKFAEAVNVDALLEPGEMLKFIDVPSDRVAWNVILAFPIVARSEVESTRDA